MAATLPTLHLLPEPERLLEMVVRLAFTLLGAFLVLELAYLLIGRLEKWITLAGHERPGGELRARTLSQIIRNVAKVAVWAVVLIRVLDILGWDVKPLLAGAGIVGVALGFGAQTLVRDLIAGIFILVENQFAVGEWIEVNGQEAQVEEVTLRHTRLRNPNGYVYFVPNGELKTVTNRSRGWNRLTVDVPIPAGAEVGRALQVCRQVVEQMNGDPAWRDRLLEPIELWGIESSGNDLQVRLAVRARPGADAVDASRELRLRCLEALAADRSRSGERPAPATNPAGTAPAPDPNLREEHP